ncbi:MAG: MBL fold metallo-hydrolase [Thaumarchaeota archaeon]|nr:MBL fold metallo-hydrolase [Candidatus Calditenuaceae archaeon]MDW8187008.1 MBL fold metallo-hydrolase [Nitrososphaerota archaeon]
MEIEFLGGAREVGGNAVLIRTRSGTKILLDYGVRIENDQVIFPGHVAPKDLDAVVLTHAHLDHSGAIPMFFISSSPNSLATEATYRQTEVLLRDMHKLNADQLVFGEREIKKMIDRGKRVHYHEPVRVKDVEIELLDAGHIPGSAQVVINAERTLLYSGDFTTVRTKLLRGAEVPSGGFDAVVVESTYAREDHRPREELERSVLESVKETVESGGIALVPAFSVARSQEVAMILKARNFSYSVYMDGMAKDITQIYLESEEYVNGIKLLGQTVEWVRFVRGNRERERLLERPSVVITPAGMLKGGPAVYYAKSIASDPRSSITLVSFQVPGSAGAKLLEDGVLYFDNGPLKFNGRVSQFKLSAHAGRQELHDYLRRVAEGSKTFTIHGEPESCEELASWVTSEVGAEGINPVKGQRYEI